LIPTGVGGDARDAPDIVDRAVVALAGASGHAALEDLARNFIRSPNRLG